MACFGLKYGLDLENRAALLHQEIRGVPPGKQSNPFPPPPNPTRFLFQGQNTGKQRFVM